MKIEINDIDPSGVILNTHTIDTESNNALIRVNSRIYSIRPNGKIVEMNRMKYYCHDCKGTTYDVNYCDNPDCPNMPCCGRSKEECDCN